MQALERILRWVVIIGVFALPFIPLIVSSSLFFPYITGKNFTFRLVVEIMFGAWLALALVFPKYRPRRSIVLGALALFVTIMAIADAHGVYPFKSFWSNYERMDGWVTLIHLLMYTVAAASIMTSENLWRWLFKTSLGVSLFLALDGFLQVAGFVTLGGGGMGNLTSRIDATFGNPIYLAVYMYFHVFLAALLWAQMWVSRRPGERLAPALAYAAVIVFDTMILFFTSTRGTILGLAIGILVAAALMVIMARQSRNAWRLSVAAVIGVLVLAGGIWSLRNTQVIHSVGFLERLATMSAQDSTVKARFMNWGMAWKGVQERPLLGWGQENYAIVFDKYYDPNMYAQEQWFDRVHNIFFDWLVAGGFLGLLSYLSVFLAVLWVLWRSGGFSIAERSILTGLLVGYLIHNFFVFDNVSSYILFGTMLAYIAWRSAEAKKKPFLIEKDILPKSALPAVTALAVVLVWGGAWYVNADALTANRTLLLALSQQTGGPEQNLALIKKAIGYGTFGTQEAREQLAQIATQVAGSSAVSADVKKQYMTLAANEMINQAHASPLDARFPLFLGVMLDGYGDYKDAQSALQQAHDLSPTKQSILFEVGMNAQARGDGAAAVAAFKQAYELAPAFRDAKLYYATVLIRASQDEQADQIVSSLVADDAAADARIASAYIARGQLDKLAAVWQAHVTKNPQDVQSYVTLASVYYQAGDKTNAIAVLQAAEVTNPNMKTQLESLIQQVQTGSVGH